ncbi:TetR/AcrR family transcriptional regulator C-terminal domain-containing protein [Saccharomonospora xinjiangensis]|uniref:Transcriptional regulator n=1 Tax=Saccharomonospora xinjiangensis XJ-54 TaxID=882086 RepID=I0V6X9_9PSEU|nr:TetR/AcrR family transcriptional regulator C-terminal domain-containing protein [Saccharomonospora xinjiangensis]EID55882.1 transcriptional regulator [Saccharomonospora xinjiangensis XJ-54]
METNDESVLRSRLRLWTTPPKPARGPAPSYTREQIADAAIAIADNDGLDAVTMRRVATELGTGAMSLYRYVENKDALVELVADRMYARHEWPEPTGEWRQDLWAFAHAQRRALLAHPWLLRVWGIGPTMGPNVLRHFERSLSLVDGLGLDIDEMVETVMLISTWTSGFVRQEFDLVEFLRSEPEEVLERELGAYVKRIADSGEYPYFARFVYEALTPRIDAETRFGRALDRILAGIEATLPQQGEAGE